MKPTILQRLLFILLLLGALALGVIVASGFLILALLLIPVILIRFYLHKRAFEKTTAKRRAHSESHDYAENPEKSRASDRGVVIDGEIVKKGESDH